MATDVTGWNFLQSDNVAMQKITITFALGNCKTHRNANEPCVAPEMQLFNKFFFKERDFLTKIRGNTFENPFKNERWIFRRARTRGESMRKIVMIVEKSQAENFYFDGYKFLRKFGSFLQKYL